MRRNPFNFSQDLTRSRFLKMTSAASAALLAPALPSIAAAEPMATKAIPKSKDGEQLPVIGLGTARTFSRRGDADDMASKAGVVRTLLEGGGSVIDTAAAYRDAEELSGELVEQMGFRDRTFFATKFGKRGRENGIQSMERSFKHLRTDMIDLMYVHNMVDVDTHLSTLKDYKAQGRIRYMGVTSTGRRQDNLATWMDDLDFVEFAYSVARRGAENRLLPAAQDKGVAVFVAMPFRIGAVLRPMRDKEVPQWAREELNCHTYAQLALKFVVSHPGVTVAIPATSNPRHMAENLDAGRGPMADTKQSARIAALWEDL